MLCITPLRPPRFLAHVFTADFSTTRWGLCYVMQYQHQIPALGKRDFARQRQRAGKSLFARDCVVGLGGLELLTKRLSVASSEQPAIDGRLPRGMGVARLTDLPAERSRQRQMLGLPAQ
jgi:hypothetical protein